MSASPSAVAETASASPPANEVVSAPSESPVVDVSPEIGRAPPADAERAVHPPADAAVTANGHEDADSAAPAHVPPEAARANGRDGDGEPSSQQEDSTAWSASQAAKEPSVSGSYPDQAALPESQSPGGSDAQRRAGGHASDMGRGERGVLNPQKIYIGGLPEHTRQEDLEDCFGSIGKVLGIELKHGFGFVEFEDPQAASNAVAKYHGGHFLGAEIRVELSHNGSRAKPYVGGEAGACFKCGRSGHWARDCPSPYANRQQGGRSGSRQSGAYPPYGGSYGYSGGGGMMHGPPPPGGYGPPSHHQGYPPMPAYDPRSPHGGHPPPARPYEDYYRREYPGYMNPSGGPMPYHQSPYGGPAGGPDPYAHPRGSAWGPQSGSQSAMGSPTFGGRGPDPYSSAFPARGPPDPRDPYGSARSYDPGASGRERSPRRRRSLSPRRDGAYPQNGYGAYGAPSLGNSAPYRR